MKVPTDAYFREMSRPGTWVNRPMRQGIHGWQVTDCTLTMTHSGYAPRQSHSHQGFNKSMSSTGEDFRNLTLLVLMGALKRAGTVACERGHRFRCEIPANTFGVTASVMARPRAVPQTQETRAASYVLGGEIPAGRVHELRQHLPALTRGGGALECDFDGARYQPVGGKPPAQPRTDHNPLDHEEYLLRVAPRV